MSNKEHIIECDGADCPICHMEDEIKRLEDRLEVYDSTGEIRLSEDCDGIACRDETIRLLDARHEGDKKVVQASEACARKHQERAKALLDECICKGNWRSIVNETQHLLDKRFRDRNGDEYTFFGIVHGSDDYYYGMCKRKDRTIMLLSCVGSLEGHSYEPVR